MRAWGHNNNNKNNKIIIKIIIISPGHNPGENHFELIIFSFKKNKHFMKNNEPYTVDPKLTQYLQL